MDFIIVLRPGPLITGFVLVVVAAGAVAYGAWCALNVYRGIQSQRFRHRLRLSAILVGGSVAGIALILLLFGERLGPV